MRRRRFLAIAAGLALAEASSAGSRGGAALVLGGGGCRGYGHIGVLRVLERERLQPDLVVGSSSGALVGALYAAGMSAAEIERYGGRMSPNLLRDWVFPKLGVFGGNRIRRFVIERVGERSIEALPTRFAAVATNLKTGEMRVLDRGDLGRAVQASASIPGLLEPVRIDGRVYVDGNLSAPVPVQAARRLGARRVVAVDVTFPPEQADLGDPFDALYQGFSILTRRLALDDRAGADVVLEPRLPEHDDMSKATLHALMDAGERAAMAALPALRRTFG
ncbi:MAG: patatin-like phospholipase family protein [Vicinamibacteria bacterium]